jgi:hypothetical protein
MRRKRPKKRKGHNKKRLVFNEGHNRKGNNLKNKNKTNTQSNLPAIKLRW